MAHEALSKMDSQLTCAVCLDRYTDPRTLPCAHSYCKDCINRLPVELDNGRQVVRCPSCRQATQLGEKGAAALPTAFFINSLVEIEETLKKTPKSGQVQLCQAHKNKPMDLYCETCEEHICFKCSTESHRDHQCDYAEDLFIKHKQQIEATLLPLQKQIHLVEETLGRFDIREGEMREQGEAVQKRIDDTYQQLINQLQESRRKVSQKAYAALQEKLQLHSLQRANVEAILVQLKSCREFVEEELRSRSGYQIQAAKRQLVDRINNTHSEVKVSELQPAQEPNTTFTADKNTLSACGHIGDVTSKQSFSWPDLFSVDLPSRVFVDKQAKVLVFSPMLLSASRLCCLFTPTHSGAIESLTPIHSEATKHSTSVHSEAPKSLTPIHSEATESLAPIHSEATEPSVECPVISVGEGQYKIMIQSSTAGLHQLRMLVDEADIYGSPFTVHVVEWKRQYLATFADGFDNPVGIAVTADGQYVVVAEWGSNCVTVLSSTGQVVRRFGSRGCEPGNFKRPWSVAVSADAQVYVVDEIRRLQKFTLTSSCEASFNTGGYGVAVDAGGKVYYINHKERKITVLNPDLTHSHSFSSELVAAPFYLAIDTKGMVYVTDNDNGVVVKFTPKGEHLATFGSKGEQPHQFGVACGICIDSNDIMYVTDDKKGRVVMFTTGGEFLGIFECAEKPNFSPTGIAVDNAGNLYVCDSVSGEVLVSRP